MNSEGYGVLNCVTVGKFTYATLMTEHLWNKNIYNEHNKV